MARWVRVDLTLDLMRGALLGMDSDGAFDGAV